MKKLRKIAIIGVGLMGGSIGLAVRRKGIAREIVGICRRQVSARRALEAKACDKVTLDFHAGLDGADFVIIATPVGKISRMAEKIAKYAPKDAIVTDVGSTKGFIVNNIERILPEHIKFVGSHPMAGSEKTSVLNADEDLFNNSLCIVTKTKNTEKAALSEVKGFWQALGARTVILSPKMHDVNIAFASHLPHVVSSVLARSLDKENLRYVSTGFKDTTRIAASDPQLWQDIFMTNREFVLKAIRKYRVKLYEFEKQLSSKKGRELNRFLRKAKSVRDKLT